MLPVVAIFVRNDFHEKRGGDNFQIEQYIEDESEFEFKVIRLIDLSGVDLNEFSLFAITNIDRCYEASEFIDHLARRQLLNRTILIPIHHDFSAIKKFYAHKFHGLRPSPFLIEKIKAVVFMRRSGKGGLAILRHLLFSGYKRSIALALNNCAKVVCIANGEWESIKKDFSISSENRNVAVIRNGAPDHFQLEVPVVLRDIDVLVCGRIEERKNQISIIHSLAESGIRLVFLGSINKNNKKFATAFLDLVSSFDNVEYVSGCPPHEVAKYYQRAKCHLSASWFEVSSLVDIEAYFSGCSVVSSKAGYSHEILPAPGFTTVSPHDGDSLRATVMRAINEFEAAGPWTEREVKYSWPLARRNFNSMLTSIAK